MGVCRGSLEEMRRERSVLVSPALLGSTLSPRLRWNSDLFCTRAPGMEV